ncbi:hypothetical protein [Streptomyces sp. NPDC096132]
MRAGVPLSPWRRRRVRAARVLLAADLDATAVRVVREETAV